MLLSGMLTHHVVVEARAAEVAATVEVEAEGPLLDEGRRPTEPVNSTRSRHTLQQGKKQFLFT